MLTSVEGPRGTGSQKKKDLKFSIYGSRTRGARQLSPKEKGARMSTARRGGFK